MLAQCPFNLTSNPAANTPKSLCSHRSRTAHRALGGRPSALNETCVVCAEAVASFLLNTATNRELFGRFASTAYSVATQFMVVLVIKWTIERHACGHMYAGFHPQQSRDAIVSSSAKFCSKTSTMHCLKVGMKESRVGGRIHGAGNKHHADHIGYKGSDAICRLSLASRCTFSVAT